jgi:hypothetical protein
MKRRYGRPGNTVTESCNFNPTELASVVIGLLHYAFFQGKLACASATFHETGADQQDRLINKCCGVGLGPRYNT